MFLQTWADAFGGAEDLKEVGRAVQELKDKGVEFPMTDLDTFAPIYTPAMVSGAFASLVVIRSAKLTISTPANI